MESQDKKSRLGNARVASVITFAISVLVFIAVSWIYFYPNDVNGDVMQQGDVMQGVALGQEGADHAQRHDGEVSRWTNALFGGMPTFQINPTYESSSMLKWVSKVYSLRFLGTPEPVSWLFMLMLGFFILALAFDLKWYYAVLGAVGYAFSSYFFIIMGAGHIWKLLVLCYIPPTIAGIVLCYRGKYLAGAALTAIFAALQLLSNHVQMTYYSAFIIAALVIAFLCKAMAEKKMVQWLIATACLTAAGGLAIAANAPNLYLSSKYAQETMRGGHSELTPLKAEGEPKSEPHETSNKGGLDKDYINMWSYGKGETFTLLIPNVKGGASMKPTKSEQDPSRITTVGVTLDQTKKYEEMMNKGELSPTDGQVMPYFTQYFGDQPGTNGPVYVGALICALFLLGCIIVKGPVKWALIAVTVLSIMLSWGGNFTGFTDLFVNYFPLYNKFRAPASALVIAEFTMPLLAVLAVHKLFTEEDSLKKHRKALYLSFGVCAFFCLLFALMPSLFHNFSEQDQNTMNQIVAQTQQEPASLRMTIDSIRLSLVSSDAWRSLLVIVVGFSILFAWLKGWLKLGAMPVTLILAAVVLCDLYAVNKRYVDQNSFVSKYDVKEAKFTPSAADLQILKDTAMNYRVADLQQFMSNYPSYFHKAVGGYHPAKLSRYNDLIERQLTKGGQLNLPIDTVTGQLHFDQMPVWNMMNTKYFIAGNQVIQNPAALGNAWFVDSIAYVASADEEMKFLDDFDPAHVAVASQAFKEPLGTPAAKSPGDTIYETSYADNELKFSSHSAKGGLAVFSEIYFPWGWKATIDGKPAPLGRVNYVLRALRVPAGNHTIVMTFKPDEVSQTDRMAKGAIIVIFVLVLAAIAMPFLPRRKPSTPKGQQE